jgi:hypothetical protein
VVTTLGELEAMAFVDSRRVLTTAGWQQIADDLPDYADVAQSRMQSNPDDVL